VPGRSWYVWILLAPPLATVRFVLAGWREHYRIAEVTAGLALSILSLVLQLRSNRARKA
jgi:hypothetical protein